LERPETGEGAPPLGGYNKLINMTLFAVVVMAVCFGYIVMFGIQRGS
jgi:type VI secretion system protein ImpK